MAGQDRRARGEGPGWRDSAQSRGEAAIPLGALVPVLPPASPGGGVRLAGTPRGTACKRWDMGPPAPPRAVSGRRSTAPRGEPVARGPRGPQTTRGPRRAFLSLTPLSGRCFVRVRLNYLPPPRAGRRTRVGRPGPRSHRAPDTARSKPLTERGAAGAGPAGASEQCLLSELAGAARTASGAALGRRHLAGGRWKRRAKTDSRAPRSPR